MILVQNIQEIVEKYIDNKGHFVVDVKVTPFNKISVFIDNVNGISVADCAELSRFIESNLNREEEDFELEVSSPGLDQPFKVLSQYKKYVGKKVDVLTKEGIKVRGELLAASEEGIELKEFLKKKSGEKEQKTNNHFLSFEKIKETKIVITFN